jgi:hypothetical protein
LKSQMTSWAGSTEVQGKVGLAPVFNWLCDLSLHAESESAGGTYFLADKSPEARGQVYPAPSWRPPLSSSTVLLPEALVALQRASTSLRSASPAPLKQQAQVLVRNNTITPPPRRTARYPRTLPVGPVCQRPTLRAVEVSRFATGPRREKPFTMSTRQAALLVLPRSIGREICARLRHG